VEGVDVEVCGDLMGKVEGANGSAIWWLRGKENWLH
jgi:hypothetical protein